MRFTTPSHLCGLTLGVLVAQRRLSHVTEAQRALAAAVDKQVAVVRVELCCRDHLRQVLHVGGLDVQVGELLLVQVLQTTGHLVGQYYQL